MPSQSGAAVKEIDIVAISTDGSGITVNGTGVAYSKSFPMPRNASFGWALKFSSGGVVDVIVDLEMSDVRPTTEEAADAVNYAIPENAAGASVGRISNQIADENPHIVNTGPPVATYGRLKLTGQGTNDATTKLAVGKLLLVE